MALSFPRSAAFALSAAVALTLGATAANAMTYTSALEYRDVGGIATAFDPAFGVVTLDELGDGQTVKVTVHLNDPSSLFINTGGPHDPFLYNTTGDESVIIQDPVGKFYDAGHGTYAATPFGNFTDKIGVGTYVPATTVISGWHWEGTGHNRHKVTDYTTTPAHWTEPNGASHGQGGDLVFTVHNDAGLTFAGVGASLAPSGQVVALGTGEHFKSNAGGWWFSADIYDGRTGLTYNVAARDAFAGGIPEPATWTMMLMGFGGLGAMLRHRRRSLAV